MPRLSSQAPEPCGERSAETRLATSAPIAVGETDRQGPDPHAGRTLNYRERACLAADYRGDRWHFGFQHDETVLAVPECPVHSPRVRATGRLLADALPRDDEFPLAFLVQAGAQVTMVLKTREKPTLEWLSDELQRQLWAAGVEGLWLNMHPSAGRVLFTKRGWFLVWGHPRSRDAAGMLHGPAAFQQLLPELYLASLEESFGFLAPAPADGLVDLYCGIGASASHLATAGASVLGIELGGEATECARLNAPTCEILRGKCAQRIPQLTAFATRTTGRRLLYANPPRSGLEPAIVRWSAHEYRPSLIAYLSCSAGTLCRDLVALTESGYEVQRITPYDFFPRTHHVETLALLRDGSS